MTIQAIQNPALVYAPQIAGQAPSAPAPDAASKFQDMLADGIHAANAEHVQADRELDTMVRTEGANLHEAMIALSRAEIALRVTTKIGQKLMSGFQEISRMQI